ncbi:MAG: excinuclease ABC subunit UvrA, partial [bacterium]
MADWIHIKGARQNNLQNIDVSFPKNRLVVITGPSGAGKSSLAFDTLYAEGQRRYVEALSPAARQFLTQLEKPDVDSIDGLGPAVAIEQRAGPGNPRSTVGTVTEIYDFLRLLYARVGHPICWRCNKPIRGHTVQQIVDEALRRDAGSRLYVCAPLAAAPAAEMADTLARLQGQGFVRFRLDGRLHLLEEGLPEHDGAAEAGEPIAPALVVDRLALGGENKQRITEAVELALDYGAGLVRLVFAQAGGGVETEEQFSRTPRCGDCGVTYPDPHPRNFSFNSPFGACPDCHGLGRTMAVSAELVVPAPEKTLADGAVAPWEHKSSPAFHRMIEQVADHYGFSIFTPFRELPEASQRVILHGSGEEELEFSYEGDETSYRYTRAFEGVVANLQRRFRETESPAVREEVRRYMIEKTCPGCDGARLCPESLHFRIGGLSISDLAQLPIGQAREWIQTLSLAPEEMAIAHRLVEEVGSRLGFLQNVGLHYLALDRAMDTLSNGEGQRIRLATQLGSALTDVIYILDEPTIGLHQRDTARLLAMLEKLRDSGSTVVVVEHDRETLERADYLIEIGPKAGEEGGRLVAQGPPASIRDNPGSITGLFLAGLRTIPLPPRRRAGSWQKLELAGATGHNLKNLTVTIPLGMLTCVTGVSGSGKSTRILDTLYPALVKRLHRKPLTGQPYSSLKGAE